MTPTGLGRKDIEASPHKVLRLGGRQILLLLNGGRLFAIANRCPHEGYPLSEGTDGPGVLTIRKAEDRILDLMSEAEPLEGNVKKAETALKEEKQEVEAEKARARERTAADQKQLDQLKAERQSLVSGLKPQVYSTYERIRKKWHGNAVAEVTDGRCSACQIVLRPQFFQDLRNSDQLMFCESCGRILFYNPPVSFEQHLAAHPQP
jgi:hypothetical protein